MKKLFKELKKALLEIVAHKEGKKTLKSESIAVSNCSKKSKKSIS